MHKQKCLVNKAQNQILEWYANNLIISKQKRIISNQKTDTQSGFKKKKSGSTPKYKDTERWEQMFEKTYSTQIIPKRNWCLYINKR